MIIKTSSKKSPIVRFAHSSVLVGSRIYIFGGYSQKEGWLNDLCYIDLQVIEQEHKGI